MFSISRIGPMKWVAAGVVVLSATAAHAIVTPGFEGGTALSDWNATGQVGTFNTFKGFVDPTEGFQQIILFTDRFNGQSRNAAASAIRLSNALGTDVVSALNGRFVRNGSSIMQTNTTVTQDSVLTFDWAFAHRDEVDDDGSNDVAFVMINNTAVILTDLLNANFTRSGEDQYVATDYFTFDNNLVLRQGDQLAFGIASIDGHAGRSALLLDNIRLTPVPLNGGSGGGTGVFPPPTDGVANPEPATAALIGLSLAAAGVATRRRRTTR